MRQRIATVLDQIVAEHLWTEYRDNDDAIAAFFARRCAGYEIEASNDPVGFPIGYTARDLDDAVARAQRQFMACQGENAATSQ